jgi:hypothetical protein
VEVSRELVFLALKHRRWNDASFFDAADDNLETVKVASLRSIYNSSNLVIVEPKNNWGTGRVGVSMSFILDFAIGLFIARADGNLYFSLMHR